MPRRPPAFASRSTPCALKGVNEDEIASSWHRPVHGRGIDITFIEVMPLGEIETATASTSIWPLTNGAPPPCGTFRPPRQPAYASGGPARYSEVGDTGRLIGFITPLTHNFCESCNRVRLTCTGTLYMCLGQEDAADLRAPLRASEGNELAERGRSTKRSPQAQGPRFHHRPRDPAPGRRPPHEHDGRLIRAGEHPFPMLKPAGPARAVSRQRYEAAKALKETFMLAEPCCRTRRRPPTRSRRPPRPSSSARRTRPTASRRSATSCSATR